MKPTSNFKKTNTYFSLSSYAKKQILHMLLLFAILCITLIASILTGKYPITPASLIAGDRMALRVFFHLRLSRTLMGLFGGFGLGITGFVYQTVFRNPLASPDIIGVSSGACVGAAISILFISSATLPLTLCSFAGGLLAVLLTLLLTSMISEQDHHTIVLAGIAIHALAQTFLMMLKLIADPEKELASIEYWIMGSLNGITSSKLPLTLFILVLGSMGLFLLYRQIILLSIDTEEALMLGISVEKMRIAILILATLVVSSVISVTGLISFIGLLAPHIARLLTQNNAKSTMFFSGLWGSFLLLLSDIFARSIASTELPVSIFTSLIGAPFFIYFLFRKRRDSQ